MNTTAEMPSSKKPFIIAAICGILFVIIGAYLIFSGTGYRVLDSWALVPRPERLTELYFTDHTSLPTAYSAGQQQTVNFTLHNIEHDSIDYQYELIAHNEDDSRQQPLTKGSVTLDHDATKALSSDIITPNLGSRIRIELLLTYADPVTHTQKQQSIHYWLKQGGNV